MLALSFSASLAAALIGPHSETHSGAHSEAPRPRSQRELQVSTPEGLRVIGSLDEHSGFLAPVTSLSPLVARLGADAGRILVVADLARGLTGEGAGEVRATALLHDQDTFVVLDGDRPMGVRNPQPPARVKTAPGTRWDLAHLVRRDGWTVTGSDVVIELPPAGSAGQGSDRHVLLFGAQASVALAGPSGSSTILVDGVEAQLSTDPLRPLVLEAGDAPIALDLQGARLDAVLVVEAAELSGRMALASSKARFDSDASTWMSAYQWPELAPDQEEASITLWIEVEGQEASPATEPDSESAAGNAARDAASEFLGGGPADSTREALVDVTLARGIDSVHFEGPQEQLDIRPTMGPGAAWGDVDGDGWLDLVILQGAGRPGCDPLADRLYCGSADGHFEDVTATAGLGSGDAGMGALLVDINGDGHLDLYCANYGQDRLFLGGGDRTFKEATALLPKLDLWSASVTAADPDGDGDLDLYVTSYLDYDPAKMPPAEELGRYRREDPIEMLPFAFPGERNVYLRNQLAETGELGFEDRAKSLGLEDVQGRGMQSLFWDFDHDGDDDLYVANDVSFNVLFRNEGDGTFKDVSFSTGLDDPRGGMGLAIGDVDRDGDEDVFLTNWQLDANALYLNSVVGRGGNKRRRASFRDATVPSGLGPSGIGKTSWGAELFDLDLDGDLDLYVANGYTSPDYESTGICVGQTDQLFLGDGKGRFQPLESGAGLPAALGSLRQASRGAIGADFDADGDVDLLVTANNGRATLLENRAERLGHWTGVRLRQDGLNACAIGAVVVVETDAGKRFRQTLRAGQGYLTGNAAELHFGLGAAEAISSITVTWPDGSSDRFAGTLDAWETLIRPR